MGKENEPLVEMSDSELVYGFREGSVVGGDVMRRLIVKTGLPEEIAGEQLAKADGSPLTDDKGNPVTVEGYLSVAGRHPGAVDMILGFVLMNEQDENFPNARKGIAAVVEGYLGQPK